MKIINIDGSEELVEILGEQKVLHFIREVFRKTESDLDSENELSLRNKYQDPRGQSILHAFAPIRTFEPWSPVENIANLLHTIPIYIRNSRPEKTYKDDIVDQFGAYFQNVQGISPYIELYVFPLYDKIKTDEEVSKWSFPETLTPIPPETSVDERFMWLFVEILIHELGHALLDINNIAFRLPSLGSAKIPYSSQFGRWREESMANAIALSVIEKSGNNLFIEFARQHMLSQPAEYALGVIIAEDLKNIDYFSLLNNKENGVNEALQQGWLEYVQCNPNIEGLSDWSMIFTLDKAYSYLGKFTYKRNEIVESIVNDVVCDFERKNGRKMTYSEFHAMFPKKCPGEDSFYVKKNKYTDEHQYTATISLADTDIALYGFFNEFMLVTFLAKSGREYKVYETH